MNDANVAWPFLGACPSPEGTRIPCMRTSDASLPTGGTRGAAAYDLRVDHAGFIAPGETGIIATGLSIEIPLGYVGLICSRSGLAAKSSVFVLNAPGVIDSDYRGEIKLIVQNAGMQQFYFNRGDRLAQIMFVKHEPVYFDPVEELTETVRGEGGFGSTGVSS